MGSCSSKNLRSFLTQLFESVVAAEQDYECTVFKNAARIMLADKSRDDSPAFRKILEDVMDGGITQHQLFRLHRRIEQRVIEHTGLARRSVELPAPMVLWQAVAKLLASNFTTSDFDDIPGFEIDFTDHLRDYCVIETDGSRAQSGPDVFSVEISRLSGDGTFLDDLAYEVSQFGSIDVAGMSLLAWSTVFRRAGTEASARPVGYGRSYIDVMNDLEALVKRRGGIWPGGNSVAKTLGCSPSTVRKAIAQSCYLAARVAEANSRKAVGQKVRLSDEILDNVAQATEPEDQLKHLIAEQEKDEARDKRQHLASKRHPTP